ncbi:DUF6443 domain-containing protein [Rhizobium leguminosarum]|uniref:DUF6443 domain-containing protein n=1 Tax=Rhizobium leguminosarum TaxID=384 RepID=UPI001C955818|nr:DUF6443 domain-containing protein [Rhizobium leguminosarum]MBY5531574.1 hypothetical protein [Rhizobium leguminosarum]
MVATYTPRTNGSGEVFSQTYYDGLGRPWQVVTPGATSTGPVRVTHTSYDPRGNLYATTFPRFAGEAPQWTRRSYDWQDRLVKQLNPDNSQRTYQYSVFTSKYWLTSEVSFEYALETNERKRQAGAVQAA